MKVDTRSVSPGGDGGKTPVKRRGTTGWSRALSPGLRPESIRQRSADRRQRRRRRQPRMLTRQVTLDEPPNDGTRSGIGLIRGWACQDAGDGVEIRITGPREGTSRRRTIFTAPYGSDRGDVACEHRGGAESYGLRLLGLPHSTTTTCCPRGRIRLELR